MLDFLDAPVPFIVSQYYYLFFSCSMVYYIFKRSLHSFTHCVLETICSKVWIFCMHSIITFAWIITKALQLLWLGHTPMLNISIPTIWTSLQFTGSYDLLELPFSLVNHINYIDFYGVPENFEYHDDINIYFGSELFSKSRFNCLCDLLNEALWVTLRQQHDHIIYKLWCPSFHHKHHQLLFNHCTHFWRTYSLATAFLFQETSLNGCCYELLSLTRFYSITCSFSTDNQHN